MNRAQRRHPTFKKAFAAEQAKQPATLTMIPRDQWPPSHHIDGVLEVWRSRDFLAVVYCDAGFLRLSVNRAALGKNGRWQGEITWDELQAIKTAIGRGQQWAVECFPPDNQLINVANIRHLWLLDEPPAFGWHGRKDGAS